MDHIFGLFCYGFIITVYILSEILYQRMKYQGEPKYSREGRPSVKNILFTIGF